MDEYTMLLTLLFLLCITLFIYLSIRHIEHHKRTEILCLANESILLKTINNIKKFYTAAYPLVLEKITRELSPHINAFSHVRDLPTPDFEIVVRPNLDTLYSSAWLDLTEPMVLSIPATNGRYYVMTILDADTNVFKSIGKRTTGTESQEYIIFNPSTTLKMFKKDRKAFYLEIKNAELVAFPTVEAWIIGRIQVNNTTEEELNEIHKIQDGFKITPYKKWLKNNEEEVTNNEKLYFYPRDTTNLISTNPRDIVANLDPVAFFDIYLSTYSYNYTDTLYLDSHKLGDDKFSMLIKNATLNAREEIINKSLIFGDLVNGWNIMYNIGNYSNENVVSKIRVGKDYYKFTPKNQDDKIDYLSKAIVAFSLLGANNPEDTIYMSAYVDSKGDNLNGFNSYMISFEKDQLPPMNAFWSLTAYNKDGYLIPNSDNKYHINNVQNELQVDHSGKITIYIMKRICTLVDKSGHARPNPMINNWLPCGDSDFNLMLRIYWPKNEVLNRSWSPPMIEKF